MGDCKECEYLENRVSELEDETIDLEDKLADLQLENQCDVCCGTGETISGVCMCGGTGKMSAAVIYLRKKLVEAEDAKLKHNRDRDVERAFIRLGEWTEMVERIALLEKVLDETRESFAYATGGENEQ